MPIKVPDSLPARATLEGENIFVMTEYRAMHQDMRPLNLLILNLMPTKIVTETQLLRKLSNSPPSRSRWSCCTPPAMCLRTPMPTISPPSIRHLTRSKTVSTTA